LLYYQILGIISLLRNSKGFLFMKEFLEATLGFENHPNIEYFANVHSEGNFRPQVVVCAANLDPETGLVICGARHWDRRMIGQADAISADEFHAPGKPRFREQGFIDQYGNFLTKEQAKIIARAAGQLIAERDNGGEELYSEEIY